MLNKIELEQYQKRTDEYNNLKKELKDKQASFLEENEDLIKQIEYYTNSIDEQKETLKVTAINEYNEHKKKQLLGGLGIRVGTELIYQEEQALKWAKVHDIALALDKRSFEKIAKTQDIDCVRKEEKITVTFPKEIKLK